MKNTTKTTDTPIAGYLAVSGSFKSYVLGFLFSESREYVVLILKNKPDWQKGLINGVGGKIEAGETPIEAMKREFLEEAGVEIDNWTPFLKMNGEDWEVHCFKAFSTDIFSVQTMTDEVIYIELVNNIHRISTTSNLQWMIPMCLDVDKFQSVVKYAN